MFQQLLPRAVTVPEWTSFAVNSIQTRNADISLTHTETSMSSVHMAGGAGSSRLISEMTQVLSCFCRSKAARPSEVR